MTVIEHNRSVTINADSVLEYRDKLGELESHFAFLKEATKKYYEAVQEAEKWKRVMNLKESQINQFIESAKDDIGQLVNAIEA